LRVRDNIADECGLFILISSEKRLALADKGMSPEVGVDLVEFDAEATDLDLTVRPA
jgi:hypothetical protein